MSTWNEISHRQASHLFRRLATGYRAGLDLRSLWERESKSVRPSLARRARQVLQGIAGGNLQIASGNGMMVMRVGGPGPANGAPGSNASGRIQVTVPDSDVEGVGLVLSEGGEIPGVVRADGGQEISELMVEPPPPPAGAGGPPAGSSAPELGGGGAADSPPPLPPRNCTRWPITSVM